jgi:ABC-2 type transport system permease protein
MVALAVTAVVGAVAFAGLGLAIAGTLRPDATLVVVNLLFLLALGFGGALVPIDDLPDPVTVGVRLLPLGALTEAFGAAVGSGPDLLSSLAIVAVWAVGSALVASRTFRWD